MNMAALHDLHVRRDRRRQVAAAVAAASTQLGRIDILMNSAGINIRGPIDGVSPDDFDKVLRVNVTGTWLTCRQSCRSMKRSATAAS